MTEPVETQKLHIDLSSRIRTLDGIRGVAILFVVAGHLIRTSEWRMLGQLFGMLGVQIFFVLSGFLITSILLRDIDSKGTIFLKNFYYRRALRIFPVFYVYLSVIALLAAAKIIYLWPRDIACAGCFMWNFFGARETNRQTWFVGHTWTADVEVQIYLLWPILLKYLPLRVCALIALGLVFVGPLLQTILHFSGCTYNLGFPLTLDIFMLGALAALLYDDNRFQSVLQKLYRWKLPLIITLFPVFIVPLLEVKVGWGYSYSKVGINAIDFWNVLFMLWALQNPHALVSRILNSRALVHLGVISYSLYLWQQLFITIHNKTFTGAFPFNVLAALIVAELSHRIIEKYFFQLRTKVAPVPS